MPDGGVEQGELERKEMSRKLVMTGRSVWGYAFLVGRLLKHGGCSLLIGGRSKGWLQVLVKVRKDAGVEMGAHFGASDGVGFARIDLEVVGDLGLDELLDVLHGVFDVDVVVAGAVDEQEMAL